ncbi:MAG: LPS export ABC transporter permease LptF, partial [Betaproteobacteria bacterium]
MNLQDDVSRVSPGVFREAGSADRVFFVEEIAGDQTNVQNVFIAQMRQGRLGITVSRRGYRESAE